MTPWSCWNHLRCPDPSVPESRKWSHPKWSPSRPWRLPRLPRLPSLDLRRTEKSWRQSPSPSAGVGAARSAGSIWWSAGVCSCHPPFLGATGRTTCAAWENGKADGGELARKWAGENWVFHGRTQCLRRRRVAIKFSNRPGQPETVTISTKNLQQQFAALGFLWCKPGDFKFLSPFRFRPVRSSLGWNQSAASKHKELPIGIAGSSTYLSNLVDM